VWFGLVFLMKELLTRKLNPKDFTNILTNKVTTYFEAWDI